MHVLHLQAVIVLKIYPGRIDGTRAVIAALYLRPANYNRTAEVQPTRVWSLGTADLHPASQILVQDVYPHLHVQAVNHQTAQADRTLSVPKDLLLRGAINVSPNAHAATTDLVIDLQDLRVLMFLRAFGVDV